MRILSFIFGSILILFALVQYNDPDPFLWMLYYGMVGYLGIIAALKEKHSQGLIIIFGLIAVFWSLTLFDGFLEFLKSDDTINSEMSKEKYYIEETREFSGLMIALGVLIFYYFHSIQLKKKKPIN